MSGRPSGVVGSRQTVLLPAFRDVATACARAMGAQGAAWVPAALSLLLGIPGETGEADSLGSRVEEAQERAEVVGPAICAAVDPSSGRSCRATGGGERLKRFHALRGSA
jgi:hypothetical protein